MEKDLHDHGDNDNVYPLYIETYRMAMHIIILFNEKKLSHSVYEQCRNELIKHAIIRHGEFTLEALNGKLRHALLANHIAKEKRWNENTINRMSLLTRGGNKSRNKSRKQSRKQSKTKRTKLNTRRSVATAIKDIPLSKARADFAALKAIPCPDINQAAKVGNAAMDHYFFRHRLATKTKRHISYYDWIRTDWKRNESEHRFYKFNLAQGKTPDKARYAVFRLYYGAIHGFKPLVAKWMYCTYTPRVGILDFSAGWGGRCLGAMSLGIPYIGIDTNVDLRPAYERMVQELDPPPKSNPKPEVTMHFQDAATADYSKFKYDMVFTSPPYFKTVKPIEGYAHMPHYNDRADFNARFLFPVIRKTYANMARGGTYALNIPDDMYDEIKAAGILPSRLLAKHRLFIQPRFAKGNPNHPDVQYKEHIYVWKKP